MHWLVQMEKYGKFFLEKQKKKQKEKSTNINTINETFLK